VRLIGANAVRAVPVRRGDQKPSRHASLEGCVCRKLRPLDVVRESLNVGHDGRADLPVLEPGFFTLQVQEPT
jgi:hypothetical protein